MYDIFTFYNLLKTPILKRELGEVIAVADKFVIFFLVPKVTFHVQSFIGQWVDILEL